MAHTCSCATASTVAPPRAESGVGALIEKQIGKSVHSSAVGSPDPAKLPGSHATWNRSGEGFLVVDALNPSYPLLGHAEESQSHQVAEFPQNGQDGTGTDTADSCRKAPARRRLRFTEG